MIRNDREYQTTLQRIAKFHALLDGIRAAEMNPDSYRASSSGFLAEIDRMQLDVREYLARLPSEMAIS